MTRLENTIFKVVSEVCYEEDCRAEAARKAALILNDKYNINCASDGSNAGDYLASALDNFLD